MNTKSLGLCCHIFLIFFQGHELTVRVLYRLQRDAEQDQDFFSSTTAASCYEAFLLAVVIFVCVCVCVPVFTI